METELVKRIKGFGWHGVMLAIPFALGFLTDPNVKALIEKYPAQLGFLLTVGVILGQISKAIASFQAYRAELAKFQ
jgi:hypothetical protein